MSEEELEIELEMLEREYAHAVKMRTYYLREVPIAQAKMQAVRWKLTQLRAGNG